MKKKTGKNKKNNTTNEVNQRIVAPGQCNILNKVEMQKSIPKSTPNPNKNLSFTTFTSFVLTRKYIGKKIKLIIKIENNKTTFAPGKCIIFKIEPNTTVIAENIPLLNMTFFMA